MFALAGGAALIVSGIVARPTNDLDFFAPHPQSVTALLEAAQAALEAEGLAVTRLSEGPTFALRTADILATVHGFRASLRDWLAAEGVPYELAEAVLAHQPRGIAKSYRRDDLVEARRPIMECWAQHSAGQTSP